MDSEISGEMADIVIMTPPRDGKWLFIGATYNDNEGQDTVQVRVYEQAYYPVYRTISTKLVNTATLVIWQFASISSINFTIEKMNS